MEKLRSFDHRTSSQYGFTLSALSQIGPKTHESNVKEKVDSLGSFIFEYFPHYISVDDLIERCIVKDKTVFCVEIFARTPVDQTTKGTSERLKVMKLLRVKNSIFIWKVTRFSSFTGKSYSSNEFTFGQRRWKLEMYPKGDAAGVGHLSLYLTATDYVKDSPKAPTSAAYKLRVLDQLKLNHYEKEREERFSHDPEKDPASWGISKFLPLEELHNTSKGLLVNDEIKIVVEFLYVSTTENL